jgi:hypothetical protein
MSINQGLVADGRVEPSLSESQELILVGRVNQPVLDPVGVLSRARPRQFEEAGTVVGRHQLSAQLCQPSGEDAVAAGHVEDQLVGPDGE